LQTRLWLSAHHQRIISASGRCISSFKPGCPRERAVRPCGSPYNYTSTAEALQPRKNGAEKMRRPVKNEKRMQQERYYSWPTGNRRIMPLSFGQFRDKTGIPSLQMHNTPVSSYLLQPVNSYTRAKSQTHTLTDLIDM